MYEREEDSIFVLNVDENKKNLSMSRDNSFGSRKYFKREWFEVTL